MLMFIAGIVSLAAVVIGLGWVVVSKPGSVHVHRPDYWLGPDLESGNDIVQCRCGKRFVTERGGR